MIRARQVLAGQKIVAEPAADQGPRQATESKQNHQPNGGRMPQPVPALRQLHAERAHPGEVVVAQGRSDNQNKVGGNVQHIPSGPPERLAAGTLIKDQILAGTNMRCANQVADQAAGIGNVGVVLIGVRAGALTLADRLPSRFQPVGAAASRFRETVDEPGDQQRRQRQGDETQAPGQQYQPARDDVSETRADQLTGEDIAVHASAHMRLKVITHQGGDRRYRRRNHYAESQTCQQ